MDGFVGVPEAIAVVAAVVSMVSGIAASACWVYCCSGNDTYTIDRLQKSVNELENNVENLREMEDQAAVMSGTEKLSSLIVPAQDQIDELDDPTIRDMERGLNASCMCKLLRNICEQNRARDALEKYTKRLDDLIGKTEKLSRALVKGYMLPDEVDIIGEERNHVRGQIWNAVSADSAEETSTGPISIHGILGVGKTAIAKSIHNQALKDEHSRLFDCVRWVTVEHGDGLWLIQKKIAERFGIDLSNNPTMGSGEGAERQRAQRLETGLRNTGKFLLILDSMWQPLSLSQIGIPSLPIGRKLLVTSRISNLCSSLDNKREFEIKPLPTPEEMWRLFRTKIQSLPAELETEAAIIESTMTEYDGIPLAINELAETLGNIIADVNSPRHTEWKDKISKTAISMRSKESVIFHSFETSYENLTEEARRCLLYCALFPREHAIDSKELIEYWMWEDLLGVSDRTLEKERGVGKDILKELKNAHLLQFIDIFGERVKMLNLIRYMAMAKEGKLAYIRSGCSLTSVAPLGRDWNSEVKRASFMCNQLQAFGLGKNMPCGNLQTLLLQDNPFDSKVVQNFFSSMYNLKVLDLSRTRISSLPASLSRLRNLSALLVRNCINLKTLPNLSALHQLIVLDLSGTPLTEPPKGIQKMSKLRRLDLSKTHLATFPSQALKQLAELEELLMMIDQSCVWSTACNDDLKELHKLALFELHFRDTRAFLNYVTVKVEVTAKFCFQVGEIQPDKTLKENSLSFRGLSIDNSNSDMRPGQSTASLMDLSHLKNLQVLYVSKFSGLTSLFRADTIGVLKKLKELYVGSCEDIITVVDQPATESKICLPELTTMVFFQLPNLKSVYSGQVLHCPNLRSIDVWNCEQLRLPMIYSKSETRMGLIPFRVAIRGENNWITDVEWDNFPGIFSSEFDISPHLAKLQFHPATEPAQSMAVFTSLSLQLLQ